MMLPSYATPKKVFEFCDTETHVECSHFMVLIQGYKVDVGFRIHRSLEKRNGKTIVNYSFERHGWSFAMLYWRNLEFRRKTVYLEIFFKNASKKIIDKFLFGGRCVLVEKSQKWSGFPIPSVFNEFTR